MELKFRTNSLIQIMLYYCVFVDFPGFAYSNLVKYLFVIIISMYIATNARILAHKEFWYVNVSLMLFVLILLYTSWHNQNIIKDRNPFLAAIVFGGVVFELFLVMEITAVKGYAQSMINIFFVITAIIVLFTDIMVVWSVLTGNNDEVYLVGTKFKVVYAHFFLIALYITKYKIINPLRNIWKFSSAFLVAITFFISILVDCATGLVGMLVFALLLVLCERYFDVLYSPMLFCGALIASFAISFAFEFLVLWEPIQHVLSNYLNREITLTSRTLIFAAVPLLLKDHYLFGYGYGTTYELGRRLGGFPNTQNALWEWIWQCGIVGTLAFLLLVMLVMRHVSKFQKSTMNKQSKDILLLLYLFTMLASVEITINDAYMGYLAMMIPLTYHKRENNMSDRISD